jgi:hypothetical protein
VARSAPNSARYARGDPAAAPTSIRSGCGCDSRLVVVMAAIIVIITEERKREKKGHVSERSRAGAADVRRVADGDGAAAPGARRAPEADPADARRRAEVVARGPVRVLLARADERRERAGRRRVVALAVRVQVAVEDASGKATG